ncbi:MAG: amidohydrolase family protein [Betaproteobacteria bacterium]|jgi:predicted TIM-barrel fold metal-dependent hydrolase|nr:amidohydrolase [Betaproteobacteria bacterium]
MKIVDSQVHIWAASTPGRPWPARHAPHRPQPFSAEDLLQEMAAAGVDRAVLVPPSWEGERNDLALAAAQAHPDRFAVMGRLDVRAPDAPEQLARWKQQPGMLGLRMTLHTPLFEPMLDDGSVDWLWPAAEKAGLPLMVLIRQPMAPKIAKIAERHPGLRLVMDHMAVPKGSKGADKAFAGLPHLLALARYPNVAVKASGIPHYATDEYPFPSLHAPLRAAFEAFGPRRLFWGTDMTKLACSYRQAVTLYTEELPWLKGEELEWVMGRGLCEWLGWKLD